MPRQSICTSSGQEGVTFYHNMTQSLLEEVAEGVTSAMDTAKGQWTTDQELTTPWEALLGTFSPSSHQHNRVYATSTMASTCSNVSCRAATVYHNDTVKVVVDMNGKDASWILTSAVIIFTMQTGFGLLESGSVSPKNEVNIMVKNALDIVFGGITYWAVGFGMSFGEAPGTNPFIGVGCYFFDADDDNIGYSYALFLFQLSFSTTATTIVSGAMAERTKLSAYIIFSLVNTFIYSIPAHWIWAESGFLYKLGAIDVAGCGPVHLVGGVTGLVATLMLKPRQGAFDDPDKPLPAPLKAILGMFMLWWGWLRFNSGSVFIISDASQWHLAVRAAVNTIVASMGGGIFSVMISLLIAWCTKSIRYDVSTMINGVLGSLVSITSMCTLCRPWEALVAGCFGAIVASSAEALLKKIRVDDPVGVVPVHMACAIWGLLCVGLFLKPGDNKVVNTGGVLYTGEFYQLGVQALTCVTIVVWTAITSYITLKIIDLVIGLRLSAEEEAAGADILEHGIESVFAGADTAAIQDACDVMAETNSTMRLFRDRLNKLFMDVAKSCEKNDIRMTLSSSSADTLTLELKLTEKTSSIDSGIEMHI